MARKKLLNPRFLPRRRGFTLVETMMAIAVSALVMSLIITHKTFLRQSAEECLRLGGWEVARVRRLLVRGQAQSCGKGRGSDAKKGWMWKLFEP